MIRSRAKFLPLAILSLTLLLAVTPAAASSGTHKPFIWPTTGRITQPFGCTGFVWEPRYGNCKHFHGGIDIADARNTPIHAAGDGVITHVGWDQWGTHNWMVIINHGNGLVTWYAHLRGRQVPGVRVGVRVKQGDVVGYMSDTGNATGVHLHWAVLKDGAYVNPRNYADGLPYRPRKQGSPTSAAACDDLWIANTANGATAVVMVGDDGIPGADVTCAA